MQATRCSIFLTALIVIGCFAACKKGKKDPDSCNGNTRREVKLLIDASVSLVDTTPISITLAELGALDVSEVKSSTERQEAEKKVYTVIATVEEVDRKRDGDWHILLKDGDHYLITECPNPGCKYAETSSYWSTYERINTFIENNNLEGKTVTITGVAFIDIDHHYKRKQAKNNLELHPILDIRF